MVNVIMEKLESHTDNLVQLCHKLKTENLALLQKQAELIAEKKQLLESNQYAQQKIEVLLDKLKLMAQQHE